MHRPFETSKRTGSRDEAHLRPVVLEPAILEYDLLDEPMTEFLYLTKDGFLKSLRCVLTDYSDEESE